MRTPTIEYNLGGLIAEMREWIADSLSCYEDHDLSDTEVLMAVGFHYEGGTDQFGKDGLK